jgi:hypothetical protein
MTDTPADVGESTIVHTPADVPIHIYIHQGKCKNCIYMSRYMYVAVVSLIHSYELLNDNVNMGGVNVHAFSNDIHTKVST